MKNLFLFIFFIFIQFPTRTFAKFETKSNLNYSLSDSKIVKNQADNDSINVAINKHFKKQRVKRNLSSIGILATSFLITSNSQNGWIFVIGLLVSVLLLFTINKKNKVKIYERRHVFKNKLKLFYGKSPDFNKSWRNAGIVGFSIAALYLFMFLTGLTGFLTYLVGPLIITSLGLFIIGFKSKFPSKKMAWKNFWFGFAGVLSFLIPTILAFLAVAKGMQRPY